MTTYKYIIITFLLFTASCLLAQSDFYNQDSIRTIKLYFDNPNWDHILDSFYINGDEERMLASVEIDGVKFDSIGIRYKGFSSVSINRQKNPFNIKLDFIKDQNYHGVEKIKLSNVIQDPSFIREVLSYDIARQYMPASRANYAEVYINDKYWGLYTNVESVNKAFLRTHYASSTGTFVKANPEHLDLNGDNCNLSNSPGADSTDYYGLYEMKSNHGWSHLLDLINTLNNDPDLIEKVLNVDRTLWMHAFNYVLINFDSYIGYAQNYYLYRDQNGQFNPIIWDLNQSFASYRLTDASIHFRGFSVQEAQIIDPLLHFNNVSVRERPLMRKLFENDRYRKMYLAHIRTIVEENFANNSYLTKGRNFQAIIDQSVKDDTNKFYSYESFQDNINITVKELIEYPGIVDLMEGRTSYLQAYDGYQTDLSLTTQSTTRVGDKLWVNITAQNTTTLILAYRKQSGAIFQKIKMYDDGQHNDKSANDGIYGVELPDVDQFLKYYFYAENDETGLFLPVRAAYEYFKLKSNKDLVINEFCASNESTISDQQGDFDDWIELYNNTDEPINLKGYFLTDDNTEINQWTFPDTNIAPRDYLIIWADKDDGDDGLHANFKLSASGETVILSDRQEMVLDEISFSQQSSDITFGRAPNGYGDFFFMKATPGTKNGDPISASDDIRDQLTDLLIFPNPSIGELNIDRIPNGEYMVNLQSLSGTIRQSRKLIVNNNKATLLLGNIPNGVYILELNSKSILYRKKIVFHQ